MFDRDQNGSRTEVRVSLRPSTFIWSAPRSPFPSRRSRWTSKIISKTLPFSVRSVFRPRSKGPSHSVWSSACYYKTYGGRVDTRWASLCRIHYGNKRVSLSTFGVGWGNARSSWNQKITLAAAEKICDKLSPCFPEVDSARCRASRAPGSNLGTGNAFLTLQKLVAMF